jgi:ribosomal-protein-alanine N-acetyltransferase
VSLEIRIRPMSVADVPRAHELDTLSFSLPWSERSYRFELTVNSNSSCWVAETISGGAAALVVGMMVNWIIMDEVHIATIAVHPNYRRLGIGRKLLAQGLLAAQERGVSLAFLEVRRGNLAAQAMYRQFGFVVSGERPRYYKDNNEDALLMNLYRLDLVEPVKLKELAGWVEPKPAGG